MKIIEEKQNLLFNRKEIVFEISSMSTPSRVETEKLISEKFSAKPEVFKIKNIQAKFGSKIFRVFVNLYSSKKERDMIEFKTKKEKEVEAKFLEEQKKIEKIKEEKNE